LKNTSENIKYNFKTTNRKSYNLFFSIDELKIALKKPHSTEFGREELSSRRVPR